MPDISMCKGVNCPMKDTCERYTSIPNEYRQTYFAKSPIKDGKCNHYVKERK